MALLGIDFGTANVRVAVAPRSGEPRASSVAISPAILSFNGRHVAAGESVLMMAGAVPDVVVPSVKRLLGRQPDDPIVRRLADRCGFDVRAGELGLIVCPTEHDSQVGGQLGVIAGAAAALRHAIGAVSEDESHEAVVAIPGWFEAPQREALAHAAKIARVRIVRFVHDVVAASLWAAHAQRIHGQLLLIDVGAGGVSGGLCRVDGTNIELLAVAGTTSYGGDDIDAQLAATAVASPGRRSFELVRQACEALKRALGTTDTAKKTLRLDGDDVELSVERWELDLMMGGLSQAIDTVVKRLFAKHDKSSVDTVLALGGMCGVAGVRREIDAIVKPALEGGPPRADSTVLGALRLAMAAANQRPMRHTVHDSEETPKPLLSDPPAALGARVSPVTKKKAVLRQRPAVTRRRVDVKSVRAGARPRRESEAPSEIPPAHLPSQPPDAVTAPPAVTASPAPRAVRPSEAPRRVSDGHMPRVPTRSSNPVAKSSTPPAPVERPVRVGRAGRVGKVGRAPRVGRTPQQRSPTPAPSPVPESAPPPARTSSSIPARNDRSSVPPARPAQMPPPPQPAAPKYPARDGMQRYPMRDQALKAPPLPGTQTPRRQITTLPSEPTRPSSPPISTPPGDPLAPSDPGRPSSPGSDPPWSRPPFSQPPLADPYTLPPGGRTSIAPGQLPRAGILVGLDTAAEILAQPITGPLDPAELARTSLPVLLRRVLARRNVFGTLEINSEGFDLRVDCEGGTASLTKTEHSQLMRAFDLPAAEWRLLSTREEEPMREAIPLARVALDGLRKLLREQPAKACHEALGERLALAPRVRSDRRRIPKRLGLSGRELRFIESYLDGMQSGEELGDSGPLGHSSCFQLLILLELYDAIEWTPVEEPDEAPLAAKLEELADRLDCANFFDVLQVHWSASEDEIAARYEARLEEFSATSANARINASASQQITARIERAWLTMKDAVKRTKHRNDVYPGQDFAAARRATRSQFPTGGKSSKPPPRD